MVSKKEKLIFLMPPKTASNSLTECLLDSSLTFLPFDKQIKIPTIHLYLSELLDYYEIDNWEDYKVIQITREPTIRYISSYFHQIKLIPKTSKTKVKDMSLDEFTQHLYKCLTENKEFISNFYGDYRFIQNAFNSGRSFGGTRTYLNQHQWNDLGADITYIKLEDLTNDVGVLSKEVGVYLPELEKKNTNKKDVDYNSLITKDISDIVNIVYSEDFKKLGY